MQRKRILGRAAVIGGFLLVAALGTLAWAAVTHYREQRRQGEQREAHVAELVKQYQAYLDETAKRIKGLPVDPAVVGQIQTRHFQERPVLWLYVWAVDNKGDFVFGVPADAFARLNAAFDQHQAVIARDGRYATRDEFLRTLLHHSRRIGPPRPEAADARPPEQDPDADADWWRFHREEDYDARERGNVLFLSSPIQDASGATVGNLNLKLFGLRNQRLPGPHRERWEPVMAGAGIVAVLAAVWLWFLLPSWVYIDAQQRAVPRPLLWSLLTLIGSVFALMVYLLSRPADLAELRCPRCDKTLNGTRAGCPYCGADLSAVFCPRCQYPVKPDWSFCPSCRGALGRTAAAPEGAGAT